MFRSHQVFSGEFISVRRGTRVAWAASRFS